ncbi:MAG TPA: LCP family protein [Pseudonocardiaceae bacterium]|nr:LCP family protein [Pseudonocardiaceae bacterium]
MDDERESDGTSGPGPDTQPLPAPSAEVVVLPVGPRRRATRAMFGVGRSVLALVAVAVLAVTGYNWSALRNLDQGIARTDVFGTDTTTPTGSRAPVVPPLTSDVNILLVGMDSRTDPHGNPLPANELAMLHAGPDTGELDTDTMILVHIPAGGQQAVAISFPRDAYVELAGGYGKHRLNSAFAYAHNAAASQLRAQGMTDPAQIEQQADTAGRKNLIATIEQLIGNTVTINRYAEINLAGFYDMSNAVGGVQVCLKAATHDSYTDSSFPAGVQTISGVQALDFVRQRHGLPGGDLDRIVRQQVFLGALASKVLSAGILTSPSKIAALSTAIQNSVTLSSGWDVTSFAAQMQGLTSGAIQFATIPTGANVTVGGADVTEIDPTQVERFVNDLVSGVAPAGAPAYDGGTPVVTTTTAAPTTTETTGTTGDAPITANGIRCVN